MGRAPNAGAPRVSPHVVPKAQASSSFGDDEEKTTIESGWEEEPSTTVEQGEVADKIRALGLARSNVTGVTNTNAGILDELTVDDQRANAALALLPPPSMNARLVITAGNDAGQHLDVTPGKSYTVGRAVDNDLVLTDIAVSRKHFDLRFETGIWVIVDRGSGNGTVVNNQIEDAPFSLANGDTIEIGNTQFRIEIPNGPARIVRSSANASAAMHDEDEPSTVASKPLRDETPAPSPPVITPLGHGPRERPKTQPPPPPLRSRTASPIPPPNPSAPMHLTMPPGAQSVPSSFGVPNLPSASVPSVNTPMRGSGVGPALGQPIAPLPPPLGAMQSRPPMSPTMLGDAMGMPLGPGQMQGGLPSSTIPGQGPPLAPSQLPTTDMFGYPSNAQMPRQHPQGPNGHVIINGVAVRDATSTALVPPTPYNGMPHVMVPQPTYNTSFSRRMKLILGGAALTLVAAISTVGIIKGGESKPAKATPAPATSPTVEPIDDKKATTKPDKKTEATPAETKPTAPQVELKPQPMAVATTPKVETKPVETKSVETKSVETKPVETKPVETKPVETKPVETRPEPKKTEPVETKPEPKKVAVVEPKKKTERKKQTEKVTRTKPEPKPEPEVTEPKPEKKSKTTAFDPSGAKNKADEQYRAKQFAAAANTLKTAAKSASDDEATSLNSLAAVYQQFGAAYNVGMAPGTKPPEAFDRLRKAQSLDNSAGKAFSGEIQAQLAKIAPKAAVAFMGAKEWLRAKQAVGVAEANGGGNDTTIEVKKALAREAGTLYKEAMSMLSADPAGAKDKLKQVRGMVDASNPLAAKAQAQLNKM
ncbi:MAG: FHA domain-containing protein [Kofleriaceae bacterium]